MFNSVGKFESRRLISAFDKELIEAYGMNMLDAKVTRQEAVDAMIEFETTSKAVAEIMKKKVVK